MTALTLTMTEELLATMVKLFTLFIDSGLTTLFVICFLLIGYSLLNYAKNLIKKLIK